MDAAGSLSVRAGYDALSADSGEVTVLAADWKEGPLEYRGTVYTGKAAGGSGNPLYSADPDIVVTSPSVATFQADAFFSLSGSVSWTDPAKQYALVRITKGDYAENVLVRGNYTERIWLRDGAGIYAVNVHRCTLTVNNLDYEGDTNGLSWSSPPVYAFTVENTRDESGIYRYPSGAVQADHPAIFNLATELIHGIDDPYWRLKAIRNEVAFRLTYDMDSLSYDPVTSTGTRKKQDALSCLESGLAVCEGYTSLYAALTRAMGFSVMAACGDAGGGHAWNLVDYAGAYRMVDVTWDDMDELGISDTYFLCDPAGVEADHTLQDTRPERSVAVDLRTLP